MNIDGSWWALIATEKFDRNTTPRFEARGGVLTWSDGITGSTIMHEDRLWLKRTLPGATPAEDVHERYQILKDLDDGDVLEGRLYRPVGDLSAYHENGLQADLSSFTLVRDGSLTLELIEAEGAKLPGPVEFVQSGEPIAEHSTAHGGKLHGKWLVLIDDEPFDRPHNRVLELDGDVVRMDGVEGSIEQVGGALLVSPDANERFVLNRVSQDGNWISGNVFHGIAPLPAGDLSNLWPDEGADENEADDDNRPVCDPVSLVRDSVADLKFADRGRFGNIDISMYSFWRTRAAGFYGADTDDEREAALQQLPSAKVELLELT